MDTALYVDQNVSWICQPNILKTWRLRICLFKKSGDFSLNREILRSWTKSNPMLFFYYLRQYTHKQKFFSILLIYLMLNARILIPLYSTKICYLVVIRGLWGFYILLRLMLRIYKHAFLAAKNSLKKQTSRKKMYVYGKHLFKGDSEFTSNILHILVAKGR